MNELTVAGELREMRWRATASPRCRKSPVARSQHDGDIMDETQNESDSPGRRAIHIRPLVGLGGVLFATFIAQFNDQLTSVALPDIGAGLGLSRDSALWFGSGLQAAAVYTSPCRL